MSSIQDIANAAYRIKESAKGLSMRSARCDEALGKHSFELAVRVRGSKTGEEAVVQVRQAQAAIRDSSRHLKTLATVCDSFIAELTR